MCVLYYKARAVTHYFCFLYTASNNEAQGAVDVAASMVMMSQQSDTTSNHRTRGDDMQTLPPLLEGPKTPRLPPLPHFPDHFQFNSNEVETTLMNATVVTPSLVAPVRRGENNDSNATSGNPHVGKRVVKEIDDDSYYTATVIKYHQDKNQWEVAFDDNDIANQCWELEQLRYNLDIYNEMKDHWENDQSDDREEGNSGRKGDAGEKGECRAEAGNDSGTHYANTNHACNLYDYHILNELCLLCFQFRSFRRPRRRCGRYGRRR